MPENPSLNKSAGYTRVVWLIIGAGAILRLLLYWANQPTNAYDDHFEPILLAIEHGSLPALNACWECHQPPLFYLVSALTGWVALTLGASKDALLKLLQFLPLLYGILTLPVIYAILKRLPISVFSGTVALALVSFLPRHIYMSAMHTNDTMAVLFVSLSLLIFLKAIDEGFSARIAMLLGALMAAAVLIKITALIVIVFAFTAWLLILASSGLRGEGAPKKNHGKWLLAALAVPIAVVIVRLIANHGNYGTLFPLNSELLGLKIHALPGRELLNFFDFRPWLLINTPVLTDESVKSFWTVIYGKFFFDMEPKFLFLSFDNLQGQWWYEYYSYFVKRRPGFAGTHGFSGMQLKLGSALMVLGLAPLLLLFIGFFRAILTKAAWRGQGAIKRIPMAVLLLANVAGLVYVTVRLPHYGSMKSAFLLNSLVPMALFFSLGVMWLEGNALLRRVVTLYTALFAVVVTVHVLLLFFTSNFRGIAPL